MLVANRMRDLCSSLNELTRELERLGIEPEERRPIIESVRRLKAKLEAEDHGVWIGLSRSVIARIVVGPAQVQITVDLCKLIASCAEDGEGTQTHRVGGETLILNLLVPVRITRSGRQKSLVTFDADGSHRLINENMVLAIGRALTWDREIRAGGSLNAIAQREGVSTTYATRVLPLAFLAPDIVEAIYKGRQPPDLKVKALWANLPLDWVDQRRALGFPAR